jgi:hypothetical protein
MVVDLPAPFGPRKANISPAATENEIWFTAVNPLKVLVKSETCIMFLSAMVNQERNSYSN